MRSFSPRGCAHWFLLGLATAAFSSLTIAAETQALPSVPVLASERDGFEVNRFQFFGHTVFSEERLQAVVAPLQRPRMSISDLDAVRHRISRYYIDQGYINSGALIDLPASESGFAQGVVPIRIIEGTIDRVQVRGAQGLQDRYLQDRLVHGAEVFHMDTLSERFRLLLSDPLFEKLESRVVPTQATGQALLEIDVVRAKPYSVSFFANNFHPPAIGAESLGVSALVRNITGWGDTLDASLQHQRGADPVHVAWTLPIGGRGAKIRAALDHSISTVIEEPLRTIDVSSHTSSFELGGSQALVNRLGRKVELGLAFVQRESKTTLLGRPFSFSADEPDGASWTKTWSFSQDWTERWDDQALALRSTISHGTNNALANGDAGTAVSPAFTLWTGQVQWVKNVNPQGGQWVVRGALQTTEDRLFPLARFSLGGFGTVRGYRENALVRDQAYVINAEYLYPWRATDDARHHWVLVPFVDIGSGRNVGESAQALTSAGIGVRWKLGGLAADFYWARRLTPLPYETQGNLQDQGVHFQLVYTPP